MIQQFLTIYAGFTHAFETDHLLAVGNIVTTRKSLKMAIKDGIFWGLGHTSTILLIGLLMLVLKMSAKPSTFHYFEAIVGLMLILLAMYRLGKLWNQKKHNDNKQPKLAQEHLHDHQGHGLAYSVGLVHGLAGSGALVVLVMTQTRDPKEGMLYLLIFGLGSAVGMLVAASLFSVPYSRKLIGSSVLQTSLAILSSLLCLGYGAKVVADNLLS